MPKEEELPWRTVIISEETGRLTHEQIREAVRAVKEESERKAAARAARRKVRRSSKED